MVPPENIHSGHPNSHLAARSERDHCAHDYLHRRLAPIGGLHPALGWFYPSTVPASGVSNQPGAGVGVQKGILGSRLGGFMSPSRMPTCATFLQQLHPILDCGFGVVELLLQKRAIFKHRD